MILADQLGLRVGAGISTGEAFVGNVGGSEVTDYTVLGDTVNVAARLQGEAAAGEILISDETYTSVSNAFPNAARRCSKVRANRSSPGRLPDHRRRLIFDYRFSR